jgi:hypothetical protein
MSTIAEARRAQGSKRQADQGAARSRCLGIAHTLRNAIYKLTIVDYEAVVDRYLGPGCS